MEKENVNDMWGSHTSYPDIPTCIVRGDPLQDAIRERHEQNKNALFMFVPVERIHVNEYDEKLKKEAAEQAAEAALFGWIQEQEEQQE